ncbi:nitroreductase family protein [Ruminococcaceae bacterium OttesenSCG-928-N02]|nr:nitroreductase family protein [Ruminococcaceae bacterium OttesenSCG-928-N02]
MDTLTTMKARYSARTFIPGEKITPAQLEEILYAGGIAPVGMPREGLPHFTVIEDATLIAKINETAGREMTYGAPTLIIVSCPKSTAPGLDYANAGCAVTQMCLAATNLGLANIYLWGPATVLAANEELFQAAGIPAGFTPLSSFAVGHTDGEPQLKPEQHTRTVNYIK